MYHTRTNVVPIYGHYPHQVRWYPVNYTGGYEPAWCERYEEKFEPRWIKEMEEHMGFVRLLIYYLWNLIFFFLGIY